MAEMIAAGIKHRNASPPLFRLARRLGFQPRLPHYVPFARIALMNGGYFCVTWGLFMWGLFWRHQSMPVLVAIGSAVFAGVLFGVFMALYYRYSRKRHGLSDWDAL
jgi:apolipoprotein N-acyltransferase